MLVRCRVAEKKQCSKRNPGDKFTSAHLSCFCIEIFWQMAGTADGYHLKKSEIFWSFFTPNIIPWSWDKSKLLSNGLSYTHICLQIRVNSLHLYILLHLFLHLWNWNFHFVKVNLLISFFSVLWNRLILSRLSSSSHHSDIWTIFVLKTHSVKFSLHEWSFHDQKQALWHQLHFVYLNILALI